MFSRIKKQGHFTLSTGVKSSYDYDYASLSDSMNAAYCEMLVYKLRRWEDKHGKLDVVVGGETEGIRIGYQLSKIMNLPFQIMPKKRIDLEQLVIPARSSGTHWLIVDDIVTTGSTFLKAVDYLEIEEKPESVTFACMIKRNPAKLDYSAVQGDSAKEQFHIRDERHDFIDRRLVSLYSEAQ